MQRPVRTVQDAFEQMAVWQAAFRRDYRQMLATILAQGVPTAVATIYDAVPGLAPGLRTALAPFNDVIVMEASRMNVPVLDLRLVCTEPDDYALVSPIEPSTQGARKIAALIATLVRTHDRATPRTVMYGACRSC